MSEIADLIMPTGLVLLGAYVVTRLFEGYSPNSCSGPTTQTCLGPICWSTCTSTGVAGTNTPHQSTTGPQGSTSFYPIGSLNIGLPAGPGTSAVTCGPFSWLTDWQNCGFSW
jgi:hypothetical protein